MPDDMPQPVSQPARIVRRRVAVDEREEENLNNDLEENSSDTLGDIYTPEE